MDKRTLKLAEKVKGEPREKTINRWKANNKIAGLVDIAMRQGISADGTMTKTKICELLYEKLAEKVMEEHGKELVEEADAKIETEAEIDPALTCPPGATNLNGMKKPESYAILRANLKVYGGILGKRVFYKGAVKWISVVTGMGQSWKFPLEGSNEPT